MKCATVIGAGLCGSLMAVYLARRGCQVTVFEKRGDLRCEPTPAGRSINLAMAERGLHALRQVELADSIAPLLIPMRGRMVHTEDGSSTLQPYGQREDEVIYSVSREHLNALLMDAAEATGKVRFEFRHELNEIDFSGRRAHFTRPDGQAVVHDFTWLLGADGAGSATRKLMAEETPIRPREELLDHGYKELTIPPQSEDMQDVRRFALDPHALHIWPRGGYMTIALPNPDGSFTVTLFLPSQGQPSFAKLDHAPAVEAFFENHFPQVHQLVPDLAKAFADNPTGILGSVYCERWHLDDRALLIGDAAHAIVPFHGQGMNLAFEDCVILDEWLARQDLDLSAQLEGFVSQRLPNANAIAQMALENYVEMRDAVAQPDFQLRKELALLLERRHPDRFIPRYSMVMFHRIPYQVCLQRGATQNAILRKLTRTATLVDEVDLDRADTMIRQQLEPLPQTSQRPPPSHE